MAKLYDRRDLDFLLYDVLKVQDMPKYARYADHSADDFNMIVDACDKIAHEVMAPTNIDGDRIPLVYDNGDVKVPESFRKVLNEYRDGGWITLMDDYDVGGQQVPASVGIHATSVFSSANFAFMMCPGMMHGAGKMIEEHGTDRQKKLYMQSMYEGKVGGSMCLTEAEAGSDVGNIQTTAKRMPDGTFRLKGQKIFITWGDHNLTENIVHPVLARIEGDPAGTKGISIFLVPKYLVNEDGTLGKRNDVVCSGIEHKMGIHGSPTTTLVFGDNGDCYAELLGQERSGMKIMFMMMNEARLGVGVQGLALAEPAYLYALEYAADRKQGSAIRDFKNPEAPRISILHHPDVRRMIMDMKSKVEAMRALIGFVALNIDLQHATEGADRDTATAMVELLTPITKSWCTDVGFDVCSTAIQVLGGHGFLRDHPIEQYMRDLKIGSLYEGTNGIQAMDLLGRKLGMKGGMVLMSFLTRIDEVADRIKEKKGTLQHEAEIMTEARNALAETAMALGMTFSGGDLEVPLLNAKPFLDVMSEIVAGWLLLWEAEVAGEKLAKLAADKGVAEDALAAFAKSDRDAAFYDAKIKTAKYYVGQYVTVAKAKLEVIRSGERSALDAVYDESELEKAAT